MSGSWREGDDENYYSVEVCHANNIVSVTEEGEGDSLFDKKRNTTETKSRCVSNKNLAELVEKLQTLQNHVVGDLEDIANNLSVVRGQCSDQLEKSLSIVKTTAERTDMERFPTKQKQFEILRKRSLEARQQAGAYRMCRGTAPSIFIN